MRNKNYCNGYSGTHLDSNHGWEHLNENMYKELKKKKNMSTVRPRPSYELEKEIARTGNHRT